MKIYAYYKESRAKAAQYPRIETVVPKRYDLNAFSMIIMKGLNILRSPLYFSVHHKTGMPFSERGPHRTREWRTKGEKKKSVSLRRQRNNTATIKFGLGYGKMTVERGQSRIIPT